MNAQLTRRRRASAAVAAICLAVAGSVAGCGDSPSPPKDRAAIRAVLHDWQTAVGRTDATRVCDLSTARARDAIVAVNRHDHPDDAADSCEQAIAAQLERDFVATLLIPHIRWIRISV